MPDLREVTFPLRELQMGEGGKSITIFLSLKEHPRNPRTRDGLSRSRWRYPIRTQWWWYYR